MFGRGKSPGMKQEGGANSSNLQAHRDVVIYGWTPDQVAGVVQEAIKANLVHMQAVAAEVVDSRIEVFSGMIADRLASEPEEMTAATSDPDVQYTIIQAGIGFARSGDDDLGSILVDLVAARAAQEPRSLLAHVIADAVEVAPRLTDGEIAALTVNWRLGRTVNNRVGDLNALADFVRNEFVPLVPWLPRGDSAYLHLQALGCVSILLETEFSQPWLHAYGGLFTPGVTIEEISDELKRVSEAAPPDQKLFIAALRDPLNRYQVNAVNRDMLERKYSSLAPEHLDELTAIFGRAMTPAEVIDELAGIDPAMRELANLWKSTSLGSLTLSAVGVAVAHANWKHMTGQTTPLSIWINDGE